MPWVTTQVLSAVHGVGLSGVESLLLLSHVNAVLNLPLKRLETAVLKLFLNCCAVVVKYPLVVR